MAMFIDRIEFNLTVKKSRDKNQKQQWNDPYPGMPEKEPEYEVYEQLDFKGLSAVEVMRKLLDYVQ